VTVYVVRQGKLVEKYGPEDFDPMAIAWNHSDFPCPGISRMEPYESPITGKMITSWAERNREMRDNNCFDARDMPKSHWKRGRTAQKREADAERQRSGSEPEFWRDKLPGTIKKHP